MWAFGQFPCLLVIELVWQEEIDNKVEEEKKRNKKEKKKYMRKIQGLRHMRPTLEVG